MHGMTWSAMMNESGADLAINRVLAAEQAATGEIERCRREAAQRLEAAREAARRIAAVSDGRIARLHTLADRAITAEQERDRCLAKEFATAPRRGVAERAVVERAVSRLIERWFGEAEEI